MSERLHAASLPRIAEQADGVGTKLILEALIDDAEELGNDVGQVCIPFIEEDDKFVPGTWVPEFWLVVRKVLDD
jgi:hypothetical protein